MGQQTINRGTSAGDGTGESLFSAYGKCNDNFDELYAAKGATVSLVAGEALTAGQLVTVTTVSGAAKMLKADSTDLTKPAMGFVLANVANGAAGDFHGPAQINTAVSGLTPGASYWLDTAGGITATAPSTSGHADQPVGFAATATALVFFPQRAIEAP